jgi:hypothetical protein
VKHKYEEGFFTVEFFEGLLEIVKIQSLQNAILNGRYRKQAKSIVELFE